VQGIACAGEAAGVGVLVIMAVYVAAIDGSTWHQASVARLDHKTVFCRGILLSRGCKDRDLMSINSPLLGQRC
jgi:hypothetical protein